MKIILYLVSGGEGHLDTNLDFFCDAISYRGFDLGKCLKMKEFNVKFLICFFWFNFLFFVFNKVD